MVLRKPTHASCWSILVLLCAGCGEDLGAASPPRPDPSLDPATVSRRAELSRVAVRCREGLRDKNGELAELGERLRSVLPDEMDDEETVAMRRRVTELRADVTELRSELDRALDEIAHISAFGVKTARASGRDS